MTSARPSPPHRSVPGSPPGSLWGLLAACCLVAGLFVVSYRGLLFEPGYVYQNWDQTIPPYPTQLEAYGSISKDAWSSVFELGSPATFNGIYWAFDALMRRGLSFLGGAALARLHFLLYALAGAAGYWLLCRRLGLGLVSSLAVCLLSQFNPRTYTMAISGHGFEIGFALALAPWAVYFAERAASARGPAFWAWALGCGMAGALGFSASPIGIVLTAAFLLVWAVAAVIAARGARPLAVLAVAGCVVLGAQAHWLLPAAATGSAGAKYNQRMEDVRAHYLHLYKDFSAPPRMAMIGHTDNLGMGTEQAYPVEGAFREPWIVSAFALLGLALLGLMAPVRPRSLKWFGALCLLGGFWMLSGVQTWPGRILYEGLLARVQMVFFLMARPMRWLPLYQAGLALMVGLGLEAVRRRSFWRDYRWPGVLAGLLAASAAGVYLWPWWSGALTVPRNATTQTMSLMLQHLPGEERELVRALHDDPGFYRITVLPTVAGPTGDVPAPPATSLTRNFGLLGKDSLIGPTFVGQPFGRFLLSMVNRPEPLTDSFGRLLGLGAVRRVVYDAAVPALSYSDFGWMPRVKRGPETLSDPGDSLPRFLAAQRDLRPDPQWSRGPFTVLDNAGYLPRLRTARTLALASGGAPLLAGLAELPGDLFAAEAQVFGTDAEGETLAGLGDASGGLRSWGASWPELLLPWLPAGSWIPAASAGRALPPGWASLAERWDRHIWFEGSPLNGAALVSDGPARLEVPLPKGGALRLLARVAAVPGQWGPSASLDGRELRPADRPELLDRGWRWVDLGLAPESGGTLVFESPGRGAVVSGVLAVPEAVLGEARAAMDAAFPPARGSLALFGAASCALPGSHLAADSWDEPLLAELPGISLATANLRQESVDGAGAGMLAAEGSDVGVAEFAVELPRPASGFELECYPRLFGDPEGVSFVRAEWSVDGGPYRPLFELAGGMGNAWEDVYGRRMRSDVQAACRTVRIRVSMRQAQLHSLANSPNTPMRLRLKAQSPVGPVCMGQGVALPAAFEASPPRPGQYRASARILGPQGPHWRDLGPVDAGPDAPARLTVQGAPGGPDEACDLIVLRQGPEELHEPTPPLALERVDQAHYKAVAPQASGRVLLFSESHNPNWRADERAPIKAYGFMNAYLSPAETGWQGPVDVLYAPQRLRSLGERVTLAVWALAGSACLGLAAWAVPRGRRKKRTP
ncbi:hypothetical protein [Fundidesulfovibrio soli]|uniref:hypothetical protein n=1 Tax=Fundidesulfovibrio soli TaxID=2922716 RepID=UPI001FAEC7E4|nr:hypothetical protein [Fundidesulfovibrio soli]